MGGGTMLGLVMVVIGVMTDGTRPEAFGGMDVGTHQEAFGEMADGTDQELVGSA